MADLFSLRIGKPAVKVLKDLPLKDFNQVMIKVISLQSDPRPNDCKTLKGYSGGYRVDQGEYRILYTIEEESVNIFRIGKRNDGKFYRNL